MLYTIRRSRCRGRAFLLVARRLSGLLLEVAIHTPLAARTELIEVQVLRDEVVAVLGLLKTTEGHLSTGNELLGVLEVVELEASQSCGPKAEFEDMDIPRCSRSR
jgi:hypothetical protein